MLRRALIILGYVVLTFVVVGLTVALVAYGNDYAYDFSTHKIIQNGHVIIQSTPNGLSVVADGKMLHKKTPYQAAYKVGPHIFELSKTGYHTWRESMTVVAGQVSLAQYAVLVPKSPVTTVLDSRSQIVSTSISKDHRHLAYITGGTDAAVYTLDLGDPRPVKLYAPKAATATAPAETLLAVTWSPVSSHLLVTGQSGGQATQWLLAADGNSAPVNLTQQYGFDFTNAQFSASDWHVLYWISPDGLRRLDVGAQTVSSVLADNVTQFWITPGRVLYVQRADLGQSLWSVDSGGHRQELIQALAASPTYSVDYVSFQGNDELAVVPSSTGIGTLYTGIFGDTPTAKTLAHGMTAVSFSPDGHLAAFSSPTSIVVYDLDRSQLENTTVLYDISGQPGQLTSLSWFDNFHFLGNRDGELYWSQFNGSNRVDLGAAVTGSPAYSSSDSKGFVMYRPASAGVHIVHLQIKQ